MESIKLEINGKLVEAEKGMTILQAARGAGIDIPTLCHDERLSPYGACRLCTVEITQNNRTRLVASCVYPADGELIVKTESERVKKIRKMILELLLPLSPSGPLESLAQKYGLEKSRFTTEPTACVLCGLCVRYCEEIKKASAIAFIGRGIEREVAFVPEVASNVCSGCRECFTLCPSGKLVLESLDGSWFPPLAWQRK
ncbi:2Fe-2S iron-sulfur cluster-binding protein [Chloroflexota bacterium]